MDDETTIAIGIATATLIRHRHRTGFETCAEIWLRLEPKAIWIPRCTMGLRGGP